MVAGTQHEPGLWILLAALARAHAIVSTVATMCTGLTRGRPAVTHQRTLEDLMAAGAEVIQARVVEDGDLISAGGITSGVDLALWLVERFCGAPLAAQVERAWSTSSAARSGARSSGTASMTRSASAVSSSSPVPVRSRGRV